MCWAYIALSLNLVFSLWLSWMLDSGMTIRSSVMIHFSHSNPHPTFSKSDYPSQYKYGFNEFGLCWISNDQVRLKIRLGLGWSLGLGLGLELELGLKVGLSF